VHAVSTETLRHGVCDTAASRVAMSQKPSRVSKSNAAVLIGNRSLPADASQRWQKLQDHRDRRDGRS